MRSASDYRWRREQCCRTLSQTSNNSNSVDTMGQSVVGSYQWWQMQMLFDKLDELINALRR